MYAIIKTGGKQYKVSEGDILNVDKKTSTIKVIKTKEYEIKVNRKVIKENKLEVSKPLKEEVSQKKISLDKNNIDEEYTRNLEILNKLKIREYPSLILKYKNNYFPIKIEQGNPHQMLENINDLNDNIYF